MKFALAIAAFACCSQAAYSADAQETPGKSHGNGPSVDVLRKVAEKDGECIVQNHALHDKAVAFVLSGKDNDGDGLQTVGCLYKAMTAADVHNYAIKAYEMPALRYLVADALVRADLQQPGPTDFSRVPPLAPAPKSQGSPIDPAMAKARSLADQVGECAARVAPEDVRRLALAEAASDAEMAAIRGLVPTFAQCLPPGVQLAFPPSVLRDASVLAYARLAYSPEAGGGGRKG